MSQILSKEQRAVLSEMAARGLSLVKTGDDVFPIKNYSPHEPHPKQRVFLTIECALQGVTEALFGGAAGGGKSDCLLMAALQYVHIPSYTALILRRTVADLELPDAIMDRAKTWILGEHPEVRWSEKRKEFRFPSGARIVFGYLDNEMQKLRYQSSAYQTIVFDELTQFTETMYTYMFSRLRRTTEGPITNVPLRMLCGSNPGGPGHDWVKTRFIDSPGKRIFIPSLIQDNPSLDYDSYVASLDELDPATREQLLNGDWDVLPEGDLFKREYFTGKGVPCINGDNLNDFYFCRHWDTAATKPHKGNPDPDWTVGLLMAVHKQLRTFYVIDVVMFREGPGEVERRIRWQAEADGFHVIQSIAEEPGSSGKIASAAIIKALAGYACEARRETGDKFIRAKAAAAQAQNGNMYYQIGEWNGAFFRQVCAFTHDYKGHDDIVDALSGAFAVLASYVKPATGAVETRLGNLDAAIAKAANVGMYEVGSKANLIQVGQAVTIMPQQRGSSGNFVSRLLH